MTNSSIPADSLGTPSPVSASYLWEVPNKSVSIQISLDVIDRMEREVIDSFKAVTKRGSEVGGVLLGRLAHAGSRTVFVENYESVTCDYSRGPLYLLADPDKDRLRETLDRLKNSPLAPVGFFRSNTRKDVALDDEDLALAQEFFSDPNQVFLLVKPFAMKPGTAGFFIWENGRIEVEPYVQFPFRRSELQKIHPQSIVQTSGKRVADAIPPGPAREDRGPVVFPKREERPVAMPPVFAKREELRPGPVVVPSKREEPVARREEPSAAPPQLIPKREDAAPAKPPVPPPVVPQREERPSAPPLTFKREERPAIIPAAKREETRPAAVPAPKREDRPPITPVTLKREEKPAVAPKQEEPPKREERPPVQPVARREEAAPARAKVEKKEEPEAVVAPSPKPRIDPAPAVAATPVEELFTVPLSSEPAKSGVGRWLVIAIILLLVAAAGTYFVYFRGKPAATQTADAGMNLRVERNAGQLVLTWNRNAPAIANAQKSTLSITDGDHKEDVDLDLGTLRSGSIVYSPITNDVGFRLEVTGANDTSPLGESVRALAGRPSPLMQQAPLKPAQADTKAAQPTPSQPQTQTPAAQAPTTTPASQTPAPVAEQPKPVTAVTVAPPKPDSLAARLRPAEPKELAEPPRLEGHSGTSIAAQPLAAQGPAVPPPAPPTPAPRQAAQAPAQTQQPAAQPAQQVKVGGNVQEAVVLVKVSPVYPPLARQARVQGIVRVEATIGADGRVKSANALSGPPLLRQSAVEAVRRWQYQPGKLNGQPVDVTTQVDISFTLGR